MFSPMVLLTEPACTSRSFKSRSKSPRRSWLEWRFKFGEIVWVFYVVFPQSVVFKVLVHAVKAGKKAGQKIELCLIVSGVTSTVAWDYTKCRLMDLFYSQHPCLWWSNPWFPASKKTNNQPNEFWWYIGWGFLGKNRSSEQSSTQLSWSEW